MAAVTDLIPMTHVSDVERSLSFYGLLGFHPVGVLRKGDNAESPVLWAHVRSAEASVMFSLAGEPVNPEKQGVLFYLYTDNLVALREKLMDSGVRVSEITYPFYMQKGEMRVYDPDGYCLLIGQEG